MHVFTIHSDNSCNITGPEVAGNSKLTVTVGKILEALDVLEEKGIVTKKDNYKSVMESIQNDIKQKSMMREKIEKELEIMKTVRNNILAP